VRPQKKIKKQHDSGTIPKTINLMIPLSYGDISVYYPKLSLYDMTVK
jgi:hypothetical protein